MKVAVTGAKGFLGWHLCCALRAAGAEVVPIDRQAFAAPATLAATLGAVDAVVHAAGANRSDDAVVELTNVGLAGQLSAALPAVAPPHVLYLNSSHLDRDTPYGRSKVAAAQVLVDALPPDRLLDLVLPGVFGEGGRPYYNSVVATFCHQLAAGEALTVHDDGALELVHAQDVADAVLHAIQHGTSGRQRLAGEHTTVVALAARLRSLHERYDAGVVPALAHRFERSLFNTMRFARYPQHYPIGLAPRSDRRGRLVELVRTDTAGQMFFSSTEPGVTRGDHYHRRKVERFVVVEGTAVIRLRRLFSEEVVAFEVSGAAPVAVDIPTLHTHHITNTGGSTLLTVFWADELFDPEAPDTFAESVTP